MVRLLVFLLVHSICLAFFPFFFVSLAADLNGEGKAAMDREGLLCVCFDCLFDRLFELFVCCLLAVCVFEFCLVVNTVIGEQRANRQTLVVSIW